MTKKVAILYFVFINLLIFPLVYSAAPTVGPTGENPTTTEPDYTNTETYKNFEELDFSHKDFDLDKLKEAYGGEIPYQQIAQSGKQKQFYLAYKNNKNALSRTERKRMYEELSHPIENVLSEDMGIITRTGNANEYAEQINTDPAMQEAIREERNQNGLEMNEGNIEGVNAFLQSQNEAVVNCESGNCKGVVIENGPDGASLIQPFGQTTKCGIPTQCTVTPSEGGTQIGEDPEPPYVGGNAHIEFGNGFQQITGPSVNIETSLPPDRNLLSGKLTMEGASNVTLTRERRHFNKVRDGEIETQDTEGSYKTTLKDATDVTVYANGTYIVGHADVLELETDKNGKKDRIIVVNGNDISLDGDAFRHRHGNGFRALPSSP